MRAPLVLFAALTLSSCSSPVAETRNTLDPDALLGAIPGCYTVKPGARPSPDVSLPTLIELSPEPVPWFVDPGPLTVREPGTREPLAPVSSWTPGANGSLELVLGGGYTGYSFSLRQHGRDWIGEGKYFADFGIEPEPARLPVRLTPRSCP